MPDDEHVEAKDKRRRSNLWIAWLVGLMALAVYLGFILTTVLSSD